MLEGVFPWVLDDFDLQACYKLKRKIPHYIISQCYNEFGSAIDNFPVEIIGLFLYSYTLMLYFKK